jgi:ketosteroid isomerase-like protein
MSEENVEIVRRGYEAFSRGDLEGMVADFAPTFEYASMGASRQGPSRPRGCGSRRCRGGTPASE